MTHFIVRLYRTVLTGYFFFCYQQLFYFFSHTTQHNIQNTTKQTTDTYSTSQGSIKREGEREGQQEHKSYSFKYHVYRNLGVLFDSNLLLKAMFLASVNCVLPSQNISKLRPMLSTSNAEILINAFMTSRLDYCNALLGGCSARLINKLQLVQNAAARVLTRTRKYDHISPVLSTLHWLPTKHRIDF